MTTAQDIADELGVRDPIVHRAVLELGIPKGGRKGYSPDDVEKIKAWLVNRMGL